MDEFTYTDDNAYFLPTGDIVPKVCPYCKCEVAKPKSAEDFLDTHSDCFPC